MAIRPDLPPFLTFGQWLRLTPAERIARTEQVNELARWYLAELENGKANDPPAPAK